MINEFLNVDLVKELGLDKIDEDKREKIVDQMTQVIDDRLNRRILALLTDEDINELDSVIEKSGDVGQFLKLKIPNIEVVSAEIVADFKKEMLDTKIAAQKAWEEVSAN